MNNTFVEVVFVDPITKAARKRLVNASTIGAIDADANGRAVVLLAGQAAFPAGQGGSRLATYEPYGNVAARLAQATPSNPTVAVSAADQATATNNQQADAQAAQAQQAPSAGS